jgi:hypothetical protein
MNIKHINFNNAVIKINKKGSIFNELCGNIVLMEEEDEDRYNRMG